MDEFLQVHDMIILLSHRCNILIHSHFFSTQNGCTQIFVYTTVLHSTSFSIHNLGAVQECTCALHLHVRGGEILF